MIANSPRTPSSLGSGPKVNRVQSQSSARFQWLQFGRRRIFPDEDDELSYRRYFAQEKRTSAIGCFVKFSILYSLAVLIRVCLNFNGHTSEAVLLVFSVLWLSCAVTLSVLLSLDLCGQFVLEKLPYLIWTNLALQILLYVGILEPYTVLYGQLEWVLALMFLTFVALPLALRWCLFLNLILALIYTIIGLVKYLTDSRTRHREDAANQIAANFLLMTSVNLAGVTLYYMFDQRHRAVFSQTEKSLQVKHQIEDESKLQERLLLSVLPKHVADQVLTDIDKQADDTQFRRIYMGRHENVSILFADIVGFTALSSSCSAKDLIKILNDLFARFDKLSQKYNQLRIKILGDCYYCISGAPYPRSDHAVLAIHMGLSMVEVIGIVRMKTQSGVNMRVGIHTGAVLAGVLGLKQWQYDVLGKEVSLANRMESGGVPGRVHISQTTASFLNGEFILESGDGETRDERIKLAGIKTFLIKEIVKPYPQGTLNEVDMMAVLPPQSPTGSIAEEPRDVAETGKIDTFDTGLYLTVTDREIHTKLKRNVRQVTLAFRDKTLESQYASAHARQIPQSVLEPSGWYYIHIIHGYYSYSVPDFYLFQLPEVNSARIIEMNNLPRLVALLLVSAASGATEFVKLASSDVKVTANEHVTYFASLLMTSQLGTTLLIQTCYMSRVILTTALVRRKLFVRKREIAERNDQVTSIRQKNQQLVDNILPPQVARDFLGTNRSDEELYCQQYDEVGVVFAACANFNDFYTEDSINNNGLECLRFLNEIISDYDELLNEPRFHAVTKIKTIGSTYMAASGMTKTQHLQERVSWSHLSDLVDFTFAMRDSLDKINSQSFNNFVLRIGISHGPVIAGVIGARKPHYDIWGNTVNVASRMESTGISGRIQVVEATMKILIKFGYAFEKRGLVNVKGKGQLMTYYVNGKISTTTSSEKYGVLPNQVQQT
ncbi:adenylate cyclase type 3-like [Tubulanus polymorphus]|uniref:adenylate cyclase type 3-like n=1 Tax=Tubulanus polymorphus TaxID=672921 RepID=UPI003DA55F12